MRSHSTIITTLAIAAVAVAPAGALGSPLLSGYGGPGTGEQQLVGGGLVGGSRGGGGGTGASGNTGGGSGGGLAGGSGLAGSSSAVGGRTSAKAGGSQGRGATGRAAIGGNGSGQAGTGSSSSPGHAARSVASTTLGLSGGELVIVALVALILLAAAVLSRWLVGLEREGVSADRRPMNLGRGH